jgi:hypothetical protein
VNLLRLPAPRPVIRPWMRFADGAVGGLTGAPLWLWMPAPTWRALGQRTAAGDVWAQVVATPVSQSWDFGDGSPPVICRGPGTPLTDNDEALDGSPDCSYRYTVSSKDQPHGRYTVRLVVTWQVSWVGSGDSGGILEPMRLQQTIPYTVRQARAQLVDPAR